MNPRTPHIRRWHQYRTNHGRGDPITGMAGTSRHLDDRLLAFAADGTFTTEQELEALTQDAFGTRLRQITLVGPSAETRRIERALRQHWDATRPPPPPKLKALPPPTRKGRPRCGQPKADGNPCGLVAGWGADTPGTGPCVHHGGSTVVQDALRKHLHQQLDVLTRMSAKAAAGIPFTLREKLDGLIALRDTVAEIEDRRRRGRPV